MSSQHSDDTDDTQADDKPQDIVCSGGIKIDFSSVFGKKDDDNGDD